MAVLPQSRIAELLQPFLEAPIPRGTSKLAETPQPELLGKLSGFLDLLVRWNARTNLTSVRDPEEMVTRHLGESLFTGRILGQRLADGDRLLDFGSGGGFPGVPVKLLLPGLQVTLAESQSKKAAFLQEVRREFGIDEVWSKRVEDMPADRVFESVTLRAVDNMEAALAAAAPRRSPSGGLLCVLTAEPIAEHFLIPRSTNRYVDLRG